MLRCFESFPGISVAAHISEMFWPRIAVCACVFLIGRGERRCVFTLFFFGGEEKDGRIVFMCIKSSV